MMIYILINVFIMYIDNSGEIQNMKYNFGHHCLLVHRSFSLSLYIYFYSLSLEVTLSTMAPSICEHARKNYLYTMCACTECSYEFSIKKHTIFMALRIAFPTLKLYVNLYVYVFCLPIRSIAFTLTNSVVVFVFFFCSSLKFCKILDFHILFIFPFTEFLICSLITSIPTFFLSV